MSHLETHLQLGELAAFQEVVRLWQERDARFQDLDFLRCRGGEDWLLRALDSHATQGLSPASLEERRRRFGSNRSARQPAPCSSG